jgi:hypothetical protein
VDNFLSQAVQWSSLIQAAFVAFAIAFGFRQLLQGSRARELQGLQGVFSAMTDPDHKARIRKVLGLQQHYSRWDETAIEAVEREVEFFQQLGFFVRHRLLRRRLVLQMYSLLIINVWNSAQPFVENERKRLGAPGFARDFERLATSSYRFRRCRGMPTDGKVLRVQSATQA